MKTTKENRRKMGWRKGLIFTRIVKICEVCGQTFETVPSSSKQFCCSRKCQFKRMRKWPQKRNCKCCGKEYLAKKEKSVCCSRICGNRLSWVNHTKKLRACQVLPRNCMKQCNRCGFDEYPQILERHHKDRNTANNNIENLDCLCPNCHDIEHFIAGDGRTPRQLRHV